jgi:hypothetical protein
MLCHVSHSSWHGQPIWEGFIAATRPVAPDPTSSLGRAPVLPHVTRLPDGAMNKEIPGHNGCAARLARY